MLTKCKMKCFRMWSKYKWTLHWLYFLKQATKELLWTRRPEHRCRAFADWVVWQFHRLCTFAAGIMHECSFVQKLCATVEAFVTLNVAGQMTSRGQKSCVKWRRASGEVERYSQFCRPREYLSLDAARLGSTNNSVCKCDCSNHKVWRSFFCLHTYMPHELSENHWGCLLQTSGRVSDSGENRSPFLSVQK